MSPDEWPGATQSFGIPAVRFDPPGALSPRPGSAENSRARRQNPCGLRGAAHARRTIASALL
ncbi:hypothetical protein XAC3562_50017 [Xanthomonas citri pv. citri]|uniref:Uncharacterized protein n=1 Tax=Xanthomonas citri pv. citri TaxID=611301 RepID=A0A0U5FFB0_XANCI|nr:hypothetical protein XAC3562_50017 [Xanthomonas citri pv. citri]CEJ22445.1 hypothetical protein XACE116_280006 [Xanthomonas citri pv. citri]CEJ27035.1 hypothetical protein XACE116_280006 [Xanthomonas citri pv. citri]CEL43610.1 hypothetical protein XAC439_280015 [Xanthomonas citri pv. citri]